MSKRKKAPTGFQKLVQQYAGERDGDELGYWHHEALQRSPWLKAMAALSRTKGKEKDRLIELLRSETNLTLEERLYLVDLLECYKLDKDSNALVASAFALLRGSAELTRALRAQLADVLQLREFKLTGRPRTPLFELTTTDAALQWAIFMLRMTETGQSWPGRPMSSKEALKFVAPNPQFAELLRSAKEGRHASFRRAKKRRQHLELVFREEVARAPGAKKRRPKT